MNPRMANNKIYPIPPYMKIPNLYNSAEETIFCPITNEIIMNNTKKSNVLDINCLKPEEYLLLMFFRLIILFLSCQRTDNHFFSQPQSPPKSKLSYQHL